ncbi:MAG: MFS transporter [Thaumarchaeota archaeon]|nr:MFS transporter [Nitrososphaerota archaeon]
MSGDEQAYVSRGLGIYSLARGLLLHGNIRVIAFTSLLTGVYVSVLTAVLQPFAVLGLGAGLFTLGLLQSVGGRPSGLASSLVQPFAGYLADTIGRKRLIVAGSAVSICSMLSFLEAALSHSLAALALGFVLFGLSLMSSPATQATIAESVAMDPAKMATAFSVVFFFGQIPGVFAAVGGFIADSLGYYVIFGAAALLESANLVLLLKLLKETGESRPLRDSGRRRRFSLRGAVHLPPSQLRIFAPFAMDAFSYGLAGSIIYGVWAKRFGFTNSDIGLIVATLSVSTLVFQYPATRFLRRVGPRTSLVFSEALTVVVMSGWLVSTSLPVFILLAVVFGVSVATWVPALYSMIMSSAPPEERGSVGGKLAAFRGLIAVPAPIIGGYLFSAFGYYLPVALGLFGEVLTTMALLKLLPRGEP